MASVRRLVLDVLKPHDPPLVDFTDQLSRVDGVAGATCTLVELDREVQNVEVTLEGENLDIGAVEETIDELGGTVHSIDLVACGDRLVTPQRPPRDA
ncbi:hypothetical protein DU500_14655 [Haloplanus rubicundus]|uniref:DUF211 domain-containing protein n=1 Tax=Haloplanus rubicundus TaxID=1547898 RepID=A0A345EFL1_9EURY|nr:DUF211 domain-containing protein [Haloplanus rubicundus]AXG07568.1 hypothetical protein DU500_14655 [Haloplanus rubicundus]AXG10983.1 hypothetical protein DU484_14625 [Haloplanus rubicundus]